MFKGTHKSFKNLILLSRPIFWLTHYAALILGGVYTGSFVWNSLTTFIALFMFGPVVSLFIYGINDVYDQKSDSINPRKSGVWGGKSLPFNYKIILFIAFICGIGFIIYSYVYSLYAAIASILFLLILGFYSIPPIRFKNVPVIDNITGGGIYALGLMIISYIIFSGEKLTYPQTFSGFITLFVGGFISQSVGSILDEDADRLSCETTSATYFGGRNVAIYSTIIALLSILFVLDSVIMALLLSGLAGISFLFCFEKVRTSDFVKLKFAKYYIYLTFITSVVISFIVINS